MTHDFRRSKINIKITSSTPALMSDLFTPDSAEPISEAELRSFIAGHLPAWQQACDAVDGDSVVLHEASFGTSANKLFLFACAIKYAATKGKHVHVATGTGKAERSPETVLHAELGSVYRENTTRSRRTPRDKRNAKRGASKKR